jgi:hypothetical protein
MLLPAAAAGACRRVRNGDPAAGVALLQLQALRARSLIEVAVVALRAPDLLAKMVTTPIMVNGETIGPPTAEELAYIGQQMALSEEQVRVFGSRVGCRHPVQLAYTLMHTGGRRRLCLRKTASKRR